MSWRSLSLSPGERQFRKRLFRECFRRITFANNRKNNRARKIRAVGGSITLWPSPVTDDVRDTGKVAPLLIPASHRNVNPCAPSKAVGMNGLSWNSRAARAIHRRTMDEKRQDAVMP
jgi:hypothetical protein